MPCEPHDTDSFVLHLLIGALSFFSLSLFLSPLNSVNSSMCQFEAFLHHLTSTTTSNSYINLLPLFAYSTFESNLL